MIFSEKTIMHVVAPDECENQRFDIPCHVDCWNLTLSNKKAGRTILKGRFHFETSLVD